MDPRLQEQLMRAQALRAPTPVQGPGPDDYPDITSAPEMIEPEQRPPDPILEVRRRIETAHEAISPEQLQAYIDYLMAGGRELRPEPGSDPNQIKAGTASAKEALVHSFGPAVPMTARR